MKHNGLLQKPKRPSQMTYSHCILYITAAASIKSEALRLGYSIPEPHQHYHPPPEQSFSVFLYLSLSPSVSPSELLLSSATNHTGLDCGPLCYHCPALKCAHTHTLTHAE